MTENGGPENGGPEKGGHGACDKCSLEYIKSCVSLDNIKYMIERKRYTFIDRLIDDARFS